MQKQFQSKWTSFFVEDNLGKISEIVVIILSILINIFVFFFQDAKEDWRVAILVMGIFAGIIWLYLAIHRLFQNGFLLQISFNFFFFSFLTFFFFSLIKAYINALRSDTLSENSNHILLKLPDRKVKKRD